ncbi:PAS domain-containing protein [Thiosocius teredinicola]|uniref:PAS domain-containing protein n=1 Tax=Thiosocius teredinicola TaxID=1973002 RepID=UPI0009910A7B
MKPDIKPVAREREMREEDFIVSKTDVKGRIVYANRVFMDFAGYPEEKLLGIQHNIVRHPDMPRAVFKMMWEVLQSDREFFGYVKNLASDGSFYWTFANVTPTHDERGNLIGYYSVRRKPRKDAIRYIEPIYAQMLAKEQQAGSKTGMDVSRKVIEACFADDGVSYEQFVLAL